MADRYATETRYVRTTPVRVTEVDGDLFIVPECRGEIVYLNPTAAALWRLLEHTRDRGEIVDTFARAFPDTPVACLERDVDAALENMRTEGLVRVVGPDTPNARR